MKVIGDLQKAALNAEAIYLAGDPDREGEAICAHLAEILSKPRKYTKVVADAVAAEANGTVTNPKPRQAGEEEEAEARTPPKILPRDVQRNHAEGHQGRLRASRRK